MSISQLALARRYRPHDFQSVVGQEATLRALMSALDNQRLHHAYLFTGTRGVGKTTLARIFAKALNCEKGISSQPCESCSACQAINAGSYVDLIEVDAASRTKVEDTRELLDNVQYLPTQGRFKIYLIDEVHMLSGHSFNALLKTLEEPPSHVKFLLATTDPQKLPITVLSRCLQFHLQRLPFQQIVNHLATILNKEAATFENEALEDIARAADGSMRDALSLLDQTLAYGHGRILTAEVRSLLGLTEKGRLIALFTAIAARDAKQALHEIAAMASAALNFSSVLTELLTLVHQIAIAQQVPEALDESTADPKAILNFAKMLSPEEIQLYYQIALLGQRDLPYAPTPQMGFEMIVLRILAFQPISLAEENLVSTPHRKQGEAIQENSVDSELHRRARKDVSIRNEEPVRVNSSMNSAALATPLSPSISTTTPELYDKADNDKTHELSDWAKLIPKLNLNGMVKELASHCSLVKWTEEEIHLSLHGSQKPLQSKRNEERLQELLSQYFKRTIALKISTDSSLKELPNNTPAKQYQKVQDLASQKAKHLIDNDPNVEQLIQRFGAKIEHVSVNEHDKIDLPWETES